MALSLFGSDILSDPFREINRMQRDMDNLFQNLTVAPRQGETQLQQWRPTMDIKSTDKELLLNVELPGVKKEDINIELANNILTISGKKEEEKKEENERYHRLERFYGNFTRSVVVPEGVSENDIQAKYDNGVLKVCVPKPAGQKAELKKINIV